MKYCNFLVALVILACPVVTETRRSPVKRQTCKPDEFDCGNGKCIRNNQVCDTIWDCDWNGPSSDENQNCPTDCSGPNQFQCSNGHCVPATGECDTRRDCLDHSDELPDCPKDCTGPNQFRCPDRTDGSGQQVMECISKSWYCDGFEDCYVDGHDEKNCN